MAQRYPLEKLFGRVITPFEDFLGRTTAGGIVLVVATILALALASVAGAGQVERFWGQLATFAFGRFEMSLALRHWVNDGLMAFFFLLVGLELKREVLVGELASLREAALPVFAAAGGMLVPALVYSAINSGTATAAGWGVPMATDIAFAVGILVILGGRVPRNLVVFLTALAIADDLGAVLVIALFYTPELHAGALLAAAAVFALLLLLNAGGVRKVLPYAVLGIALWYAIHESGVHATLAGILLATVIPARPSHTPAQFDRRIAELHADFRADRRDESTPDDALGNQRMACIAEAMERTAAAVQSPLQRMEHRLARWVTFAVVPVFALANAAIDLGAVEWGPTLSSPVALGAILGLVLGKFVGIGLFSAVAVKAGWGRLPEGVGWAQLLGAAWLAGIGFTMSIFIAQLAFSDALAVEHAKIGIMTGSAASALIGIAWLLVAGAFRPKHLGPGGRAK